VLCLTVSGTLSAWTTAVVHHNDNTATTLGSGVILQVAALDANQQTVATCDSAADSSTSTNESDCGINLYANLGVTANAMFPGATNVTTVLLTNTGPTPGDLTLKPSACDDGAGSLCDKLTIKVSCGADATRLADLLVTTTLNQFATTGPVAIGPLQSDVPLVCTFITSLPFGTNGWSGQSVTQPITWTLTAQVT
jgi:hypothetical protein